MLAEIYVRVKKKLLHIEFLRILCIWLVMFTHSATSGFSLYIPMQHSRWFPLYILVPFWVKISVPIFFMISGALLLGKDEPISVVFKKRIWRFSQVLVTFSFISYVAVYRNLNMVNFATLTYTSTLATAYYFHDFIDAMQNIRPLAGLEPARLLTLDFESSAFFRHSGILSHVLPIPAKRPEKRFVKTDLYIIISSG